MSESIDNVTMVKESTGDLSRSKRIEALSRGRLPFFTGSNPRVLDGLRAGAAGWCTAALCQRPRPCNDLHRAVPAGELSRAHAIYAEVRPPLEFIVVGGMATAVKAGVELRRVGVGDPRRPLPPLCDEGCAALQKVLSNP
jgi:4-hydroxy-tetrahydrodipicolinate synthase